MSSVASSLSPPQVVQEVFPAQPQFPKYRRIHLAHIKLLLRQPAALAPHAFPLRRISGQHQHGFRERGDIPGGHEDPVAPTLSLIHISEPTRRTPISYAVFCLKKKKNKKNT